MYHRASKIQLNVTMALGLAVAVLSAMGMLFYHPVNGYSVEVILSGSMRPGLQPGGLILMKRGEGRDYSVGSVVTFHVPGQGALIVTHRVARRFLVGNGTVMMNTKGDANPAVDAWVITSGNIIGKQVGYLPYIGYVIEALKSPIGFLVFACAFFVFFVAQEIIFIGRYLIGKEAYAAHGKAVTHGD